MKRFLIPSLFFLGACATDNVKPEPVVVTKEVKVPVVQLCPDKRNPAPSFVDTVEALNAAADKGPDAVVALLLGGRAQRDQRLDEDQAQIAACSHPPDG